MNTRMRGGKSSELIVAGELLRHGLDVYLPCVDDRAIDLLIRTEDHEGVRHYDVQVKSVRGYNRIVGLKNIDIKSSRYILILHYRHDEKADESFYLTKDQVLRHYLKDSKWGDLVFNKVEREQYAAQTLADLGQRILRREL
ncbi:MAG: hypothetical protein ACJ8CR_00665 [Roseiflexaceae bacterium]